jgi:pyruvate formate lyase activating enzyme
MLIGGFEKLTLLDYPEKTAAMIFTRGCTFLCPFCHNPELIFADQDTEHITEEEVLAYLKKKKKMIDGLVITGGEPTIHKDLGDFIKKVRALGLSVKLDTNGTSPETVERFLKEKIVDYFAMDLKHTWEKYNLIGRSKKAGMINDVRKTFALIQQSHLPHEFRTTVFPGCHSEEDFFTMASYLLPGETYFLQNIRYGKTLDKNLDQSKKLDVTGIVQKLKEKFPELIIEER